MIEAYWFCKEDRLPNGDGRPVAVGTTHRVKGKLVLCKNALHASEHPFDALQYAPGNILYKVECSGEILRDDDKIGCRQRKYLARLDAAPLLRELARRQALSVIHLWDAPDVVRRYLETGDEALRAAARAAACKTACKAAQAGAWAVAWEATREAVWETAWAAARETAGETAREQFKETVEATFEQETSK